jgi:hypothetical protein
MIATAETGRKLSVCSCVAVSFLTMSCDSIRIQNTLHKGRRKQPGKVGDLVAGRLRLQRKKKTAYIA